MAATSVGEQIRHEGAQALAEAHNDVVIEDVSVSAAGKRRVVRITVARDLAHLDDEDHTSIIEPLTLDEVAAATRTLNEALDASDAMGASAYTLEVSSAGVGKPLREPAHFRRNVGRLLEVSLSGGEERAGRLVAAAPAGITLRSAELAPIAYQDIARASVQVEFSRPTEKDT